MSLLLAGASKCMPAGMCRWGGCRGTGASEPSVTPLVPACEASAGAPSDVSVSPVLRAMSCCSAVSSVSLHTQLDVSGHASAPCRHLPKEEAQGACLPFSSSNGLQAIMNQCMG